MAKETQRTSSKGLPVNEVPIDQAFLDIPDDGNEAIADARKTYVVTFVSAVIFVAVILFFILL